MPALTPEQEALKQAALAANELGLSGTAIEAEFRDHAYPAAILDLLAQLEGCNEDYGFAVDSVAQLQDDVFALHRQLAAETLRADQGWERYESANADRNSLRASLVPSAPAQTGTLICQKCGVDRAKEPCKREHWQGCGMAGTAYNATVPRELGQ